MRNTVKLVMTHFFIITTGVLFITSLSNLIAGRETISAALPWQILLTGMITALPSFLFYFKNEPTKNQFLARCIIHFFLIEAIVMTEGKLLGWYDGICGALIHFGMILFIYLFVWIYSYFMSRNLAKDINSALREINENED